MARMTPFAHKLLPANGVNEAIRGDLAWHFYFWLMRDGYIKTGLADPFDPAWKDARRFIDTLPMNLMNSDPAVLYYQYISKSATVKRRSR